MSCVNIVDNDSTLVYPPTFAQEFECAFRASNHDASASLRIAFYPDGTWQTRRVPAIGPNNGRWHVGTPANPADFEIRITGNVNKITTTSGTVDCMTPPYQETNTPVDTGWVSLSVMQEYINYAYATANINCDMQNTVATFNFTITIRQISNPANSVTGSGSTCAEADAMAN